MQFASTIKSRISPDLEKGNLIAHFGINSFYFFLSLNIISIPLQSEEEEEDEDEESEDETGDLVLQSSSLSTVDEEKELIEPPVKQPRMNLNLHTLTESQSTPP